MKLTVKLINILPDQIEKYIIKKLPLNSFGITHNSELIKIQQQINNKFGKNINLNIISSIKSTYMKESIIKHHHRLEKYSKYIIDNYHNMSILALCSKLNLSPMTLLRFILEHNYKSKLKYLIANNKLNTYDKKQLEIASANDIYANLDNTGQLIEAIKFEKLIEEYLIEHDVKYLTQNQLDINQIKIYGHSISTPDFQINSDLIINNQQINWIDAKNFYGANSNFIINKINKQIKKYIINYGPGCIIFNHGFNSKFMIDNVLILDYDSLIYK